MEEKDDYDVFIEEAENVIEHYTAGEDVQYELNRLLERALLVDPINAPCRDAEAINAYNLLKRAIDTESPINIPITPIIRQRQRSHSSNDHNNLNLPYIPDFLFSFVL
ncbi:hypothetical protein CRE_29842 [Caenorhabditis remanei]|uniref:Uncharacterized protein n=1 Tax=Caenorhabditis remanei TaxID=31234 RepID=E3LW21_CAERE|nr:hypothetical protein CRE_29842 [Caenorhabditis remanei]